MIRVSTLKLSFCLSLVVHGAVFSAVYVIKREAGMDRMPARPEQLSVLEVEVVGEPATGGSPEVPEVTTKALEAPSEVAWTETERVQTNPEVPKEASLSAEMVPVQTESDSVEQQPRAPATALAKAFSTGSQSETPAETGGATSASADYLFNPRPSYPIEARRHRKEGLVTLNVWVTSGGCAEKVLVRQSSGCELLDHAAVTAVRQWRFIPAQLNKITIASWAEVPIRFKLSN
jgi:protein TonB